MNVAVVGDVGIDYYQNLEIIKPGGIAFNFAYNLKKSGVKDVSLVSILGKENYSKKLLKLLKEVKIGSENIQIVNGNPPKQNILLKKGERKFNGYDAGVLKKWKLRKKDLKFIENQNAVFVPLSDGMEQIFNAIKNIPNLIKVTDFSQDYEFADYNKKDNLITKNAKYFDIIFIGGQKKYQKMVEIVARRYPKKIIVLTLGSKGSLAYHLGAKYIQPSKKVKIVDTTGCGDAFQAGFLHSWLTKKDIKAALIAGTNRATKNIEIVGSTPLKME